MKLLLWIAAIIVLIGFIDIVLRVKVTGGKPELVLSVLFVKIPVLGGEKKSSPKKEQKPKEEKPKKEAASNENAVKKDPFFASVGEAVELVRNILSPVGKFITGIRITGLKLRLSIGGEDAAAAAIRYGQVRAAVHLSLTELRKHFQVKAREITVDPNFFTEKMLAELEFQVRVSIGSIFIAAFRGLGVFIRHLIKYKGKNLLHKKQPKIQEES